MTHPDKETSALLDEVYQQLAGTGKISRPQFLKIYGNDEAAAISAYDDLKEASIVSPIGETHEIGEIPPVLDLTDFGMSFLISKGYTVRPRA